MDKGFLFVDHQSDGDVTEFRECDGKVLVKHFASGNSEYFVIKKNNGKRLTFSFIKLHGIYYITLNGNHMMDYKKFSRGTQSVVNNGDNVIIKNIFEGDITIENCDMEIVQKSLTVMSEWMKKRNKWWNDILYLILH